MPSEAECYRMIEQLIYLWSRDAKIEPRLMEATARGILVPFGSDVTYSDEARHDRASFIADALFHVLPAEEYGPEGPPFIERVSEVGIRSEPLARLFTRDTALSAVRNLHAWAATWAEKAEGSDEAERSRRFRDLLAEAEQHAPR